jgi:predicted kinase
MSGAPGSGKTTLGTLLAKAPSIDGVLIDHDMIKSFFLDSDITFDQSTKLGYNFQLVLAEEMLKQGRNVVIDSTCNSETSLNRGMALARKLGYEYKYVECRVKVDNIDLLDKRIQSREQKRSQRKAVSTPPRDAGSAAYHGDEGYRELFRKWIENPCRPNDDEIIVVYSSQYSPEKCLEHVLQQIESPAEGQTQGT